MCSSNVQRLLLGADLLDNQEGYEKAREILQERYGQSHLHLEELIVSLAEGPRIRSRDGAAIKQLADNYLEAMQVAKASGYMKALELSYITKKIAGRLPASLFEDFKRLNTAKQRDERRALYPKEFYAFLDTADSLVTGGELLSMRQEQDHRENRSGRYHESRRAIGLTTTADSRNSICFMCEGEHNLASCEQFRRIPVQHRQEFVRKEGICFLCLRGKHRAIVCKSGFLPCDIEGCGRQHSRWLHMTMTNDPVPRKRKGSADFNEKVTGEAPVRGKKAKEELLSFGASAGKMRDADS